MGVADIRVTLSATLTSLGKVSNVRMRYLGGGKQQSITFTLTHNGKAAPREIIVPGGTAFIPALIAAATEFVDNFPREDTP